MDTVKTYLITYDVRFIESMIIMTGGSLEYQIFMKIIVYRDSNKFVFRKMLRGNTTFQ